ncbi:MAG TPA: hypothetical protein VMT62_14980 [Syntrophorhabdaceae bacterium]|nr:hypothetical protein [Syntrophorhabdaceae bacterium]
MNKRAHRKAFFILVAIGLIYMSIAFNLADRFSMKRTSEVPTSTAKAALTVTGVREPEKTPYTGKSVPATEPEREPSFFISVPIVSAAIKEGLIEKDGLVLIKKASGVSADFKRPLQILKDKDEEGLKSIAGIVGKKELLHLLRRDGISVKDELDAGDIILGRSYTVDKTTLLALFDRHVTNDLKYLFPFACGDLEIDKGPGGFVMSPIRGQTKKEGAVQEVEWVMPNLASLPMKAALEKLAAKTSNIRVYGNGFVTDQNPKAYEKVKGETDCEIYGRSAKQ